MPRFVWILLAACSINADYSKAHVRCSDGMCPSGQTCFATGLCGFGDAAGSARDAGHDARTPALTCNDPGDALGTHDGNTGSDANHVSAMCGNVVYNGRDAVYMLTGPRTVSISVTGLFAVAAYAVTSCSAVTCEGGSAAGAAPLSLSLGSGTHFIVVDTVNPADSGMYTLNVQ